MVLQITLEPEARLREDLLQSQRGEPEQDRRDQPERGGGRAFVDDIVILGISGVDEPWQLRGSALTKAGTIEVLPRRLTATRFVDGLDIASLANCRRSDHAASQLH
jgi:hypothetical protein